jgi:hypothetical protein
MSESQNNVTSVFARSQEENEIREPPAIPFMPFGQVAKASPVPTIRVQILQIFPENSPNSTNMSNFRKNFDRCAVKKFPKTTMNVS